MKKKRLIIGGVIVIAIVVFVFRVMLNHKENTQIQSKSHVILLNPSDIITVKLGEVDQVVPFTGDLSPLNQTIISSEVDAQVSKVLVKEGQFVKKDQLLAILDSTDLKDNLTQKEASLKTAISNLNLNKQKFEKQKDLFDQGFISKFSYDELRTNYQNSEQDVKQEQALVNRARKQLSFTQIKAPFDGYIYQKTIDNGQIAVKNNKLFALASLDLMQIVAAIPSYQIKDVKVGQVATFKVEANSHEYSGKVTRINPVAEEGTRAYLAYIMFDNTKAQLNAGLFAKGQIVISSQNNIPYISTEAITNNKDGSTTVLLVKNNQVELHKVKVLIDNQLSQISGVEGLNANDQIIAGNVITVKPGDKVEILK